MYKEKRFKAIILAAGSGLRMGTKIQKQYIKINDRPMLAYSLEAFEKSPVDEIIVVVKAGDEAFCQKEIADKYNIEKVKKVISGGNSRYHSTAKGLAAAKSCDYILIHDAARPCVTTEVIMSCMDSVMKTGACTAGVTTVDTINRVTQKGIVLETLDRNFLWSVQTPQAFQYEMIRSAHERLKEKESGMSEEERNAITDDVKVLQLFSDTEVHMSSGSYENIKVTTPADLKIAQTFLADRMTH